MIVGQIKKLAIPGTVIPKPVMHNVSTVKGWSRRRGEEALIYFIPNPTDPTHPHEKGITRSEWENAYSEILSTGEFTRKWFMRNMQACNGEGSCNFTTIGGIMQLLGVAEYRRGKYVGKRSLVQGM